jgi:hypothetical protein
LKKETEEGRSEEWEKKLKNKKMRK